MIDNINIISKIDQGNQGTVYKASHKGRIIAVKTFRKQRYYETEKEILSNVPEHPNLLPMLKAKDQGVKTNSDETSEQVQYITMPFCKNGDFLQFMMGSGPLPNSIAKYYILQLADALEELHCHEIVHLDVKLENCLISDSGNLMLADFGLSSANNTSLKGRNGNIRNSLLYPS